MVEKKLKPPRREPGQRRLQLPERPPRQLEENPIKATLAQAKVQEQEKLHTPTTPTTGTTPTTPTTTTIVVPIAPARDFTRVANSIVRKAVPDGYFTGKSKQLYDYLYSVTRGAIVPVRSIRMPMSRLMNHSGIGSDRTLRKNLARLVDVGLIVVTEIGGTQGGNEFTVFLPEELPNLTTPTTPTTPTTHPVQKVGGVQVVESGRGGGGLNEANTDTSTIPKTSFKTTTIDDEAFAGLIRILQQTTSELTGLHSTHADEPRWTEVAQVIAAELKDAASKTTVSSVPAFLATHLKRRFAAPQRREKRELASQPASEAETSPETPQRLTNEDIHEQSRLISDLLDGGYTWEQAESQFSRSFHQEDWEQIKAKTSKT